MSTRNSLLTFVLTIASFFSFSTAAFAQPTFSQLEPIAFSFLNLAVNLASFVAVAMIMFSGYTWMIAAGDPQRTKSAQGTFTWAVIGLVLMFLIRTILLALFSFLGV